MKNWQKNIILITLVSSLLTGCSFDLKDDYDRSDLYDKDDFGYEYLIPSETTDSQSTNPNMEDNSNEVENNDKNDFTQIESSYHNRKLTPSEIQILNSNVNIYLGVKEAIEYIKGYEVIYPYSELYSGKIPNPTYQPKSCNAIISNGRVDYSLLLQTVLENNAAYMSRYNISSYSNTTKQFVEYVCKNVEQQVNTYLFQGLIDEKCMNEKLNDLKVFSFNDFANGLYISDRCILAINTSNLYDGNTVNHEIVHFIQSASVNELSSADYLNRYGFCFQYSDNKINPTYWNWFFESAAESLSMEYNNASAPSYYADGHMQLESLKLANFKFDNDLEKALLCSDVNAFYKWFGAEDEETKNEINNMFYALTILLNNNPGEEGVIFYKTVSNMYQQLSTGAEVIAFQNNLKGVIALTQTKLFYNNLLKRVNNKSVKLEDVFEAISVFELELSRQTWYDSKYAHLESFLKGYADIQTRFFGVLSINCNLDVENIEDLYYLYNENYSQNNADIGYLNSNENQWFRYIVQSRFGNKKSAIIKKYEECYQNNYQK